MLFRRRVIKYPNILEIRDLHSDLQCEACKEQAVCSIRYETNPTGDTPEIYLCSRHQNLAKRRSWQEIFKDQNQKIGE